MKKKVNYIYKNNNKYFENLRNKIKPNKKISFKSKTSMNTRVIVNLS